jgi:alpha-beta hydrolase superfamily lysophospholipase
MPRHDFYIPSRDGVHQLHVVLWKPEKEIEIKGVVQISHGMQEMIERYENFALFLNQNGYVVIGNDHLGHGLTAGNDADLGYFCPDNMSATVVDDLHRVTRYAKKKYKNKPYFLLGHSMGSFMARRYIMRYGDELDGAIICGTGSQTKIILVTGKVVANLIRLVLGDRFRSRFLKANAFGAYQKRIVNPKTDSDWITRDEKVVASYKANKYCNFIFTVNGYRTLFEVLTYIQKEENIKKIPKELPLYFISGEEDPVGNYGAGVRKICRAYQNLGIRNISLKLYPDDRHEVLNELNRDEVYQDVLNWIEKRIKQ